MSTRSEIGVELHDKSVISIYCHSDGYLAHNGRLLKKFYNSKDLALELVYQNDCSFLGQTIQDSRFYNSWRNENTKFKKFPSSKEYLEEFKDHTFIEYCYLFKNNRWCVLNEFKQGISGVVKSFWHEFIPLENLILEEFYEPFSA